MQAESDLILAQTFKSLEPTEEPAWSDDVAINDLWLIHERKVASLNRSVYALIKVQDLVNRLLHESLGGDLVKTNRSDWEEYNLNRKNVEAGLKFKVALGVLSKAEFDAITYALAIPKITLRGEITKTYRNRLMHHVQPSVDYSMFFSALDSRIGDEVKDAQGKVIGRRYVKYAKPPIEFKFQDLHAACSEYLDAAMKMLQDLSMIDILRR